jgi:hypothetical protein
VEWLSSGLLSSIETVVAVAGNGVKASVLRANLKRRGGDTAVRRRFLKVGRLGGRLRDLFG